VRGFQDASEFGDFLPVFAACVGELLAEPADQGAGRCIGVGVLTGVGDLGRRSGPTEALDLGA
jgi:hypothetical protein